MPNPGLKSFLYRLAAGSGVPAVVHRSLLRKRLAILMYHGVAAGPLATPDWCFIEAGRFARQMELLARRCEVLPLLEALDRLRAGRIVRPTACITFDDGYLNNAAVALPILRRLGLPATIFLTTELIGTDDTVWFCRLHEAVSRASVPDLNWGGERWPLACPADRAAASAGLQARLKRLDHDSMLAACRELIASLGDDPGRPIGKDSPYRMLDRPAVGELAASGLIELGAHGHGHAILTRVAPRRADEEIERSVRAVEALTGKPCRAFAYPNGGPEDFGPAAVETLKRLGVQAAVTTIEGPNLAPTDPLRLRRYGIGADMDRATFELTIHHIRNLIPRPPGG